MRTSCLPVCFESVYRDTVLALDFGLRSTSRLWRQSVRADSLSSPSGPGRSPFQAHVSVSVAAVHNRGVAGTRLTACVCHCWHSLLGHRLRIVPRYGIRPRSVGLVPASRPSPALSLHLHLGPLRGQSPGFAPDPVSSGGDGLGLWLLWQVCSCGEFRWLTETIS